MAELAEGLDFGIQWFDFRVPLRIQQIPNDF